MKKIAFIGGFDKLDLILYIGVVLKTLGKKVLIVDSTDMQKSKYLIPSMEENKDKYIATAQDVQVAIGYSSYGEVEAEYISKQDTPFDYVFLNTDNYKSYEEFNLGPDDLAFFTTTFDIYSLKKGLEVFSQFKEKKVINKILFARNMTPDHIAYIMYITKDLNITWGDYSVFFPYDNGDLTIIFENQREYRMNLNKFSKNFLNSFYDLCLVIAPEEKKEIRKLIKQLTK